MAGIDVWIMPCSRSIISPSCMLIAEAFHSRNTARVEHTMHEAVPQRGTSSREDGVHVA